MSVSLDTMLARVAGNISRYSMFPPDCRVGVAVSGGADSVCLLHILRELAPRWNLHLSVVHVDHGIRGEASAADARFVRDLAGSFGFPFHLSTGDVPEIAKRTRDNLEQAAREFRKSFFSSLIRDGIVDRVATGHTRDDQAETVLFHFLRGSGTAGLAGIHWVTSDGLVRPLLNISRAEIEAYLFQTNPSWREDASNRDLSYTRNRIRHELLPMLATEYNPQIRDALLRTATIASEDEDYWQATIPPPVVRDGIILLNTTELTALPPAVARRTLRRAIDALNGDLRQIGFDHIDAILQLASAEQGSGRFRVAGLEFWRSFDWLRLTIPFTRTRPDYDVEVLVPGTLTLRAEKLCLRFDLQKITVHDCDTVENIIDWDKTLSLVGTSGTGLRVRNWRPGDRYRPPTGRDEKIKQMFQDNRVPIWDRAAWPLLTLGGEILWARRFGPAAGVAPDEHTSTGLRISEEYLASA